MACPHCIAHFYQGHSVCPVCQSQRAEETRDRQVAATASARLSMTPRERLLIDRGIFTRAELTEGHGPLSREGLSRNRHRAEVFRMTGLYFREEEAAEMLAEISHHRWIEAEKAGRDIWTERDPKCPRCAAGRDWFARYFTDWLQAKFGRSQASYC